MGQDTRSGPLDDHGDLESLYRQRREIDERIAALSGGRVESMAANHHSRPTPAADVVLSLFSNSATGINRLAPDLTIVGCNEAFARMIGTTPEMLVGTNCIDLVDPADRPACQDHVARLSTGEADNFILEKRFVSGNGDRTWARVSVSAVRSADGTLTELVAIIEDIGDRHAAEQQLEDALHLLRVAGNSARIGGWSVTLATNEIDWSDEVCEIHDLPPGTRRQLQDALDFYSPEWRPLITQRFNACAHDGVPYDEELQIVTARGRKIWVRSVGEPVRDRDGRITHVQGAFQDISERKLAEEALIRTEARLTATLESMTDAFFTLDREWRFTYVNSALERIVGTTRDQLIGRTIWEAFPATRERKVYEEYLRAVRNQQAVSFEIDYPPLGGHFDVTVYPSEEGVTVFCSDITLVHRQRQQLNLLEAAVKNLNDIVIITQAQPLDEPGPQIVYVNEAFEHRTGYSREEVIGESPRFLQGPLTQRHELDRIRHALQNAEPVRAELINYTKSGATIWLEIDIVPLIDSDGMVTHSVAVERDITERKMIQATIEQQAALLDHAQDAIIVRDMDHTIRYWNRAAERLYGWTRDEAVGRSIKDLLYVDPTDFALATATTIEKGHWSGRIEQRRRDGKSIFVQGNWTAVSDERGKPRQILAINTDLTDRLALERQLQQSQRLEAVGQLTGGVAHDFNNLLTVILGNSELLKDELEGNERLGLLADMTRTAAERGAELTNRLLAFARRQALDPKAADVNLLITDMDSLLRRTLGEQIEIELACGAGLWDALVDPSQLESALLNLSINARDAMDSGGRLTIETSNVWLDQDYANQHTEVVPGQYVMVAVSDTGCGMDPDTLSHAFEPFFTTKGVGHGSGLGLSMVYGFIKQSRGHVKIYSEPDQGTTVKLYLPRAAAEEDRVRPDADQESTPGGAERILVVEDNDLVRDHVTRQLVSLGYQPVARGSGPEAMDVLKREGPFDLLFTDVVMPGGMSGRDLADQATALYPDMPVLFTSGYTENAIIHHGRLDRGAHLLQKPYRRIDLARRLRSLLARS